MRCRIFFISGIMGLAVISGIIRGLASPRDWGKKEGMEETGKKEVPSPEKAEG